MRRGKERFFGSLAVLVAVSAVKGKRSGGVRKLGEEFEDRAEGGKRADFSRV